MSLDQITIQTGGNNDSVGPTSNDVVGGSENVLIDNSNNSKRSPNGAETITTTPIASNTILIPTIDTTTSTNTTPPITKESSPLSSLQEDELIINTTTKRKETKGDQVDNISPTNIGKLSSDETSESTNNIIHNHKKSEINTLQVIVNPNLTTQQNSNNNSNNTTTTTTTTTNTTLNNYQIDRLTSSGGASNHFNSSGIRSSSNYVIPPLELELFTPSLSELSNGKPSDPFGNEGNSNNSNGGNNSVSDKQKSNLGQSQKVKKMKSERRLSNYRPKSIKYEHKRNLIGETVYKGHPSWALMLNIQTGIRNAVGKSMSSSTNGNSKTPQQYHTLREPKDFQNKLEFYKSPKELKFETAGSTKTEAHSTGVFKFKDYCPIAFRYLRYRFGIDQADFLVSLCNTLKNGENALRELPTPGKSGSLFFFSHDMKFIIKTIPKDEAKLLRSLLPAYTEHLSHNPNTLLPRFFGLFRVKPSEGRQVRFVVMGNNFPTRKKIHERFDLKGSIIGREASENERKKGDNATYKDIDFRNRNKKICLGTQKRTAFLDQIKKDCSLLESLNIMDYSLLIGIHYSNRDPPSPSLLRSTLGESIETNGTDSPLQVRANTTMSSTMNASTDSHEAQEVYTGLFQQDEGGVRGVGDDGQPIDEHYFLGIIDILMLYSLRKKVEHSYRALTLGSTAKHNISAVPPSEYSERFQEFMKNIIV